MYDVKISLAESKTDKGTDVTHQLLCSNSDTKVGIFQAGFTMFAQTDEQVATLRGINRKIAEGALKEAAQLGLPAPQVNDTELSWTGLSLKQAHTIAEHSAKHNHKAHGEIRKTVKG